MDEDGGYMEGASPDSETAFQKAFGWFAVLNKIADNDITRHEVILKKGLIEVLNQLTYMIQLDKIVQAAQKAAFNKQNK
jgi:hypothetical protein